MQRAIVALGEVLAHSVGSSEKRRLLAPTLAMGQVLAVTPCPFAGLCVPLCTSTRTPVRRTREGVEAMAGLSWAIDCKTLAWYGRLAVPQAMAVRNPRRGPIMCVLLMPRPRPTPCLGCTHLYGAWPGLPMLAFCHSVYLYEQYILYSRTCVKRAAFPRCISVHFRVSFADVDPMCFSPGFKAPSSTTISPYLPPLSPRCLCVPGIDLQAFPFLSSSLLSSPLPFPILSSASSWRAFSACGALPVVAYLRPVGYSVFLSVCTHWPLICSALLEPQQLAVICRWR
ncbi:hypothetical protein J3F84DRAFT_139302 [Trichoderma pleuroticola]